MRSRRCWWLGAVLVLVVQGCDIFGPTACDTIAKPALTVEVADATTGSPIVGALVTATDGDYADSAVTILLERPGVALVDLATERKGTYDVSVEKEGYRLWTRKDVRVRSDESGCHVATVRLKAELQPLASSGVR